jgi:ribosomal-protein-alanine N-acetyltransferase
MKIESPRCVLRALQQEDAESVYSWASDPIVSQFMSWQPHCSVDETREFINSSNKNTDAGVIRTFGIVLRQSGEVIGTCGFSEWNEENRRAEIAFALEPRQWGKGIMRECLTHLLPYGFSRGLQRIQATCELQNERSKAVLLKLGFEKEGVLRRYVSAKDGQPLDLEMYSILSTGDIRTGEVE